MKKRNACILRGILSYGRVLQWWSTHPANAKLGLKETYSFPGTYIRLTNDKKLQIVNDILKIVKDDNIKQSYEDYKKELSNPINRQYFENVVLDKRFKARLETPSNMYRFISQALNSKLYKEMQREIDRILVGQDRQGKITLSSEDLQNRLNYLRQYLFAECKDSVNAEFGDYTIYETDEFYDKYKNILKKVEDKLSRFINSRNGFVNDNLTTTLRQEFFNLLKDYTMLVNFDKIVSKMSNGYIGINRRFEGVISTDQSKYFFKDEKYTEASFLDNYSQIDGKKITPNILKQAVQTVDLNEEGDTASPQIIRLFISAIRHIERDTDDTSNYGKEIRDFFAEEAYDPSKLEESIDIRKLKFLKLLSNPAVISRIGEKAAKVAKWLTDYEKAFQSSIIQNASDRAEFRQQRDLVGILLSEMHSQEHMNYVQTTEDGNIFVTNTDRGQKKWNIYETIVELTKHNAQNGIYGIYNVGYEVAPYQSGITITDIFSEKALQNLQKIFGFSFRSFDHVFADKLDLVGDAITMIQELFYKHFGRLTEQDLTNQQYVDAVAKEFEHDLVRDSRFVKFSDELVKVQETLLHNLTDQNDHILPGEGILTTIGSFKKNKLEFEKHFTARDNNNIISRFPSLTSVSQGVDADQFDSSFVSHIMFRSDIMINKRPIPHVLLEPDELMTVALSFDFLQSIFNGDTFCLLTECYSDKPRIPIMAYNLHNTLKVEANDKLFIELSTDEIINLYKELNRSYFLLIEDETCQKWSKILKRSIDSIKELSTVLEKENLTEKDLHDKILQYQKANPQEKFNFIKENDYIISEDDKVGLNASLVMKIASAHNDSLFEALYNEGKNAFLEDMAKGKNIPNQFRLNLSNLSNNDKIKLCNILGLTHKQNDEGNIISEDLQNFLKQGVWNKSENGKLNQLSETILSRYYAIQTLFKDADLQISIKHPWLHDGGSLLLSSEEVQFLYRGDVASLNNVLHNDYVKRLIKGKKRNSSAVAAYTPMQQGLKDGVPRTMKVAMVKFPQFTAQNHFGITEELKPHDGASHTDGIWSYFEEHSYLGHNYKGPKKTIGLIPHLGGFTQIKHADLIMSNEWIRNSFNDTIKTDNHFDGEHMVKVMRQDCFITKEFAENWMKNKTNSNGITFDIPMFSFNGRYAQLTGFEFNGYDGNAPLVKFLWRYTDDLTPVDLNLVAQMVPDTVVANGFVKISNIYQLWKAFGGARSMEETETGEVIFSEISNILCAQMICEYDPSMKDKIIAKICDTESVKSSQIAVNQASDLTSGNLTVSYLDTSRYGLLQDYTHESEDSKIPALTLVITAIAFNGHNLKYVNTAYEALGRLVHESIANITVDKNTNATKYYRQLGAKLLKSLEKNAVASSAVELIQTFLEDLQKDEIIKSDDQIAEDIRKEEAEKSRDGRKLIIPFSHKDLFYKVSSDLVSQLNNDTIKQKFAGIAVIQCPSHGIVGVYEDSNGIVYTRSDILRLAHEEQLTINDLILLNDNALIEEYFKNHPEFSDEEITKENIWKLNIGDRVNGEIIEHPDKLREYYDLINNGGSVIKNHNKQRDLAVTKIVWKDNSGWNNLFCIESTRALIKAGNDKTSLEYLSALEWHRANLAGLREGFYYKTKKDFINKQSTLISGLTYTPGEQIVPKVHTAFNEGNYSLSEIIRLGKAFFEKDIRTKLEIKEPVSKNSIGIATDTSEIIISSINELNNQIPNTIVEYDDLTKKNCIKNANGDILITIPEKFKCAAILTEGEGKPILHIYAENYSKDYINQLVTEIDGNNQKRINNIKLGDNLKDSFSHLTKLAHGLIGDNLEDSIDKLSTSVFNSWKLYHYTISTRIPSQSYQSFLATKTVAYTENNLNMGYMNIWEMWFQGSDFDIDKAYTLMYGIDSKGRIAGNIFTNYDSVENILRSLNLSLPEYTITDNSTDETTKTIDQLLTEAGYLQSWQELRNLIDNNNYDIIENIITLLNNNKNVIWRSNEDLDNNYLRKKFINYKHEGQESLKNRIANVIWYQTTDLRNLESAELPMSMKPVTSKITLVRRKNNIPDDVYYSEYNPYTVFRIQRANSIGKDDVGISANGVKAAGALHQHFNRIYQDWDELTIDEEKREKQHRSQFNIDLDFSRSDGSKIGKFKFFKLANTIMPKQLFESELKRTCGSDYALHPMFDLFTRLKNGEIIEGDSEREKVFISLFNTYIKNNKIRKNQIDFADFLYWSLKFEDNVADIISIFISMSTDNAKELALAKIYATPELLSMPLAMLTLGMDIESTIDVCVNILSEVESRLSVNRYINSNKLDVRQVIQGLHTKTTPDGKSFDFATINSLLAIYDFAQELRTITGFFKVNLGVTTKYTELKSWISNLASSRATVAESKGMQVTPNLKTPLLFSRLFSDDTYKKDIISQYDLSKTVVNVMDVVLDSPHFSLQLLATDQVLTTIQEISAKSKIVDTLVNISQSDLTSQDKDLTSESEKPKTFFEQFNIPKTTFENKGNQKSLMDKVIKLVDHWVITQYLATSEDLDLSIADIQKQFPTSKFSQLGSTGTINFDSAQGINKFLDFMNFYFIPNLFDKFPYNQFIEGLESATDRRTKKKYFDFKYDPYELKDNPTLLLNYNIALNEFEYIKNMSTGIHSLSGREFTIGELLYLYSIIVCRGEIRGMYTIVQSVGKESNLLNGGIDEQYRRLDDLVQNKDKTVTSPDGTITSYTNEMILNQLIDTLRPYVQALANDSNITTILNGSELYKLDLNKEFLYTMNELQSVGASYSLKNLAKFIESKIPLSRVTIKEINSIDLGNNKKKLRLFVGIELQDTLGQSLKEKITYNIGDDSNTVEVYSNNGAINQDEFDKIIKPLIEKTQLTKKYVLNQTMRADLQHTSLANSQFINIDNELISHLPEELLNFKDKEISVYLTRNGKNFIRRIGNSILYVLNPNSFSDIKEATMNYIDLYIQSITDKQLSEKEKIATLIKILSDNRFDFNTSDIDFLNQKGTLQKLSEKIEDPKRKSIIRDYAEFIFNMSNKEAIKASALIVLSEYENAIDNKDFYYIKVPRSIEVDCNAGDICIFNGVEKLFVFDDGDHKVFTTIHGIPEVSFEDLTNIQTHYKRIANKDVRFGKLSKDNFNYTTAGGVINILEDKTFSDLIIGDLINFDNEELLVTDISFYELGPTKYKLIVFLNTITKTLTCVRGILNESASTWILGLRILKNRFKITRAINQEGLIVTNPDKWISISSELKDYLLQHIIMGSYIKTKSGIYKVAGVVSNNIVTTSGEEINKEDIEAVQFVQNELGADYFFNSAKPKQYWDNGDPNYVIKWRPELADGFLKSTPLRIKGKSTSKVPEWTQITACKRINNIVYPDIAISSDMMEYQYTETLLKEGDIFINYITDQNNTGITELYQVVDPVKKIAFKVSYGFNEDNSLRKISETVVKLPENVKMFTHYTHYKNYINKNSYSYLYKRGLVNECSINEACIDFLLYILNKFGIKINYANDQNSDYFAKLENNTLIINIAKKSDTENISNYIMKLAAHEFTHLLFAAMKANNPSVYAQLITLLRNNIDVVKAAEQLDHNTYTSEAMRLEEIIIRRIESNKLFNSDDVSTTDIQKLINSEFGKLFLIRNLDKLDYELNLKSIFKRYKSNFIQTTEINFNLDQVRRHLINEEVFSKTLIYC